MDRNKIDGLVEKLYIEGKNKVWETSKESIDPFVPHIYPFQVVSNNYYVRFESADGESFYSYFQPCYDKTAPLLVHVPCYGGEMSIHPELSDMFHVLHINPLGYVTPKGKNNAKLTLNGLGTVLPDTITSKGEKGYFDFFLCCVAAIEWAKNLSGVIKDRISFFGTSQGGFSALFLGSIYSGRGTKSVAADQPFLTNYELAAGRGAYSIGQQLYKHLPKEEVEETISYYDTKNHIHRYKFPVLLTSGGKDAVCPPDTIRKLAESLSGTFSYTHFEYLEHGYNKEFIELARAWFKIYA